MFTVTLGGCNSRHPETFFMSRPNGLNHYLLLIIKSHAKFRIADMEFTVQPHCALLIDRNTPYEYQSIGGEYINDWMHFDCSDHDFLHNASLPFHKPIPLGNMTSFSFYIQQIIWEKNYSTEQHRSDNINMLMHVLINNIIFADQESERFCQYSPYYSKLQRLRLEIQYEPYKQFTPEDISSSIGISSSYFQHLYTSFFGVSFKSDLINMRIEYAKSMILNSNLKIEQIAEICGYNSLVHFYRQFNKKTGMTPREFCLKESTTNKSSDNI